jgi:hypothetical protein
MKTRGLDGKDWSWCCDAIVNGDDGGYEKKWTKILMKRTKNLELTNPTYLI